LLALDTGRRRAEHDARFRRLGQSGVLIVIFIAAGNVRLADNGNICPFVNGGLTAGGIVS
jgi:hypothetical protein